MHTLTYALIDREQEEQFGRYCQRLGYTLDLTDLGRVTVAVPVTALWEFLADWGPYVEYYSAAGPRYWSRT